MCLGCGVEIQDRKGMKWVKLKTSVPKTLAWLRIWTLVSDIIGIPTLPLTSCLTTVNSAFISLHFTSCKLGIIRPPHVATPALCCLPLPSDQLSKSIQHYSYVLHVALQHDVSFLEYLNCKPSFKLQAENTNLLLKEISQIIFTAKEHFSVAPKIKNIGSQYLIFLKSFEILRRTELA